jgi:hypothetical protein
VVAGVAAVGVMAAASVIELGRLSDDPSGAAHSSTPGESLPTSTGALGSVAALRATADADAAIVETLVGQWVPQVSQRRVGSRSGAVVLRAEDIVALHTQLQQQVGAVLLNSSDYVFRTKNLWVSIVPEGFATAEAALDRCATLPATDQPCIARLITHDSSVGDTSKQRRA